MRTLDRVIQVFTLFVLTAAMGCQAPPAKPAAVAPDGSAPPRLALETFDEVWRILDESHFDTNYNGHNWQTVRERYRPRVAAARTQREVREAIDGMLKLLNVSHLALVPGELADAPKDQQSATLEHADEEESGAAGFQVRYVGSQVLVTSVSPTSQASSVGVRPGWILQKVEGKSANQFKTEQPTSLDERRRDFLAWRALSKRLSGAPGTAVECVFLDGKDEARTVMVKREQAAGEPIQFGSLPVLYAHLDSSTLTHDGASIGMVRFNIWMLPTALAFHRAIDKHRSKDGMIIDLRGNVGGVVGMIIGVAGHFVREPIVLGQLLARDNTLKLPANPRFSDATGKRAEPFAGPVAILVDEITASASEVFAGGLQEHGRVRVFGRTTAGQALPAVYNELPNGDSLYHPVADFITPKGTRFEGRGVVPDETTPLDRAALLRGADPALEAAKRWIAAQKNRAAIRG